jgi:hypothetical protein
MVRQTPAPGAAQARLGPPGPAIWDAPQMRAALLAHDFSYVFRVLVGMGYTQSELSELTTVKRANVSIMIRAGQRIEKFSLVVSVAAGLGIPGGYVGLACCPCAHRDGSLPLDLTLAKRQEFDAKLKAEYEAGATIRVLMDRHDLVYTTVHAALKRAKTRMRTNNVPLSAEEVARRQRGARLFEEGVPWGAVAQRLGFPSPVRARQACHRYRDQ